MNHFFSLTRNETKRVLMTPSMADELLKLNSDNRAVRKNRVREFTQIIQQGEWKFTHQGVAVGADGKLLDGQHRLLAISQSGRSAPILLTTGLHPDARLAIDTQIKRSYADLLRIDEFTLTPVTLIARIGFSKSKPTPEQVQECCETFLPYSERLIRNLHCQRLLMGSAAIRAGALVRLASGVPFNFVRAQFEAMLTLNMETLAPVARSFVRQIMNGHLGNMAGQSATLYKFAKSWIVFGDEHSELQNVHIKNLTARMDDIRIDIRAALNQE